MTATTATTRPDSGFSYTRDQFRTLVEDALALAKSLGEIGRAHV